MVKYSREQIRSEFENEYSTGQSLNVHKLALDLLSERTREKVVYFQNYSGEAQTLRLSKQDPSDNEEVLSYLKHLTPDPHKVGGNIIN